MSLPAMAFFTALPCGVAIRWLMITLTAATGLALYWFLRGEGVSRLVATVGGLVLGLGVAGSGMATTFRFPGTITFTALTLGAVGRFMRAPRMATRILWLMVAAVCFGQLAATYLGMGLAVGSVTLLAYLAATLAPKVRSREWSVSRTLLSLLAMAAAFVAVNLAYLLPRLAYASRINLSLGYGQLTEIAREYLGRAPPFPGAGTALTWPLNFALVPGRYLGGVLVLVFAGFWSARKRLVWAFASVGLLCYVASLQVVVDHVPKAVWQLGLVDQYLHRPFRMVFGLFIPMGVLAALGVEAWLRTTSVRTRILMLVPGVVVWMAAPLLLGAPPRRQVFLVLGATATVGVLFVARRVPVAALALAPLLAMELVLSTLFVRPTFTFEPVSKLVHPVPFPPVLTASYLDPTPIAHALQAADDGRYLTLGTRTAFKGLDTNQGTLFGIESTQGYLSVQLLRYWLFIRALSDTPQSRQYAFFHHPPPIVLDLLQVNWIVAPKARHRAVEPGSRPVTSDAEWTLFRRPVTVPRASALFDWTVVGSRDEALRRVAADGFDFAHTAVLEEDPGIRPGPTAPQAGTVTYTQAGPQAARVEVDVPAPAVILIRNVFDRNWRATVDGEPARLLAVDSVVQGVAVSTGRHVIELKYDDPTVGLGLLATGITLVALGALAFTFWRRERRTDGASHPADADRESNLPATTSPNLTERKARRGARPDP
jgi:hypothetical protein